MDSMRSLATAALAAFTLVGLGCRDSGGGPESPFTFFARPDMRAGVKYSVMDDAAKKESIGQFVCKDLWEGGKSCQLEIDPGVLTAMVNAKGRVVHLKISSKPNMRGPQYDPRSWDRMDFAKGEYARMRDAWSMVNAPEVTAPSLGSAQYRWVDDQSRWTAGMWYSPLYTYFSPGWKRDMGANGQERFRDSLAYLPDSVVTIDEFAYEEYMKLEPAPQRAASKGPPSDPLERLQFDLAMVASAQAEYFEDHATFATATDALIFLAGDGVHIELQGVTRQGWAAIASHDRLPGMKCVLYSGSVEPPPVTPGGVTPKVDQIACDGSTGG
jgi:hypothetical protein